MNVCAKLANAFLLYGGSVLGEIFRSDWKRKFRKSRKYNEKKVLRLLWKNRNTEYGKKYNFSSIKSIKEYQDMVPLSVYDDYKDYINRMIYNSEKKLITYKNIKSFALTSGTTNKAKIIPHSKLSGIPFFKSFCIWTNDMVKAFKSRGIPRFNAKGFLLTEIGIDVAKDQETKNDDSYKIGHVSAYAVGILKYFLPLVTQLPLAVFRSKDIRDMRYIKARFALQDPDLNYFCGVFMSALYDIMIYIEDNHEMLINDIEKGVIDSSIAIGEKTRKRLEKKLKPNPKRAAELRKIFESKSETPLINRIWKNMSYIFAIGTGDFDSFTRKMRSYCEKDVVFGYTAYASTEAFMGCAIHAEDPAYLLVNDDCFFEFLPVGEDVKRPLLIDELKENGLYELIITNKTGLYRFKLGDVVRVMKLEGKMPYVQFAYRSEFVTDMVSIHLTGEQVKLSIKDMEDSLIIKIIDYALYPNYNLRIPRLELFIEPEELINKEIKLKLDDVMDKALIKNDYSYMLSSKEKQLDKIKVFVLKKGTFTIYREKKVDEGASLNQLKTIRMIRNEEQYKFFKEEIENIN